MNSFDDLVWECYAGIIPMSKLQAALDDFQAQVAKFKLAGYDLGESGLSTTDCGNFTLTVVPWDGQP